MTLVDPELQKFAKQNCNGIVIPADINIENKTVMVIFTYNLVLKTYQYIVKNVLCDFKGLPLSMKNSP